MELEKFKQNPIFNKIDILLNARMDGATESQMCLEGLNGRTRLRYYAERSPHLRNLVSARKRILEFLRRV
jgi:hypothetical protein